MHRRRVLELLRAHVPYDEAERASLERINVFVLANPDCFERSLRTGHVTGSAWIVDADYAHVLLTHHRKLDMWLQLGGHADGDSDVHRIPARNHELEHFHYDVRFLLRGDPRVPVAVTEESKDLSWFALNEVASLGVDASVMRMVAKTRGRAAVLRGARDAT